MHFMGARASWCEKLCAHPGFRLAAEIARTNAAENEVQRIKAKFGKKLWDVEGEHKLEVSTNMR